MPAEETEDTDYALGRHSGEYDRLIEQARQLAPLTHRVLVAAGIGPGMRVLDMGCGVGDVSMLLHGIVGPTGSVVAADLDAEAVRIAEGRCADAGIDGVEFIVGDAREVDGTFDAVAGRFVLMYTTDPTATLRTAASLVRPGGVVVFHEWISRPTAGLAVSTGSALARLQGLLGAAFARSGAHLEIGAELYRRMREAGLDPDPRPLVEFAVHLDDPEQTWRRWYDIGRSVLPKMVEYGLLTDEEGSRLLDVELRDELVATPFAPLSPLMVGQWGRRPG